MIFFQMHNATPLIFQITVQYTTKADKKCNDHHYCTRIGPFSLYNNIIIVLERFLMDPPFDG